MRSLLHLTLYSIALILFHAILIACVYQHSPPLVANSTTIVAETTPRKPAEKRVCHPPILVYAAGPNSGELKEPIRYACQYWNRQAKRILFLPGGQAYGLDLNNPIGFISVRYATESLKNSWRVQQYGFADRTFRGRCIIGGTAFVRRKEKSLRTPYLDNMIAHELGHFLGLLHDNQATVDDLMNKFLTGLYKFRLQAGPRTVTTLQQLYPRFTYGGAQD